MPNRSTRPRLRGPRIRRAERCHMTFKRLALLVTFLCSLTGLVIAQASNTASVTLYRPKRFSGSGLTPSIHMDGKQILRLDNGRYYTIEVSAGKHTFESSMKKHAPVEIELKPGESFYLEMLILPGTWRGGGRLTPTSEGEAKEAMKKLKPLDAKWVSR